MQGENIIKFLNLPDEEYIITMPNIYARGILFGKMYTEIGDHAKVSCSKSDLVCEVEFKVKGIFTGGYNIIQGKVKKDSSGEVLYSIHGKWSDAMTIVDEVSKEEKTFLSTNDTKQYIPKTEPLDKQEEYESQR
jgi:hypothetical protein